MGEFVNGAWRDGDFPHDTTGHFVRPDAPFRNWVTASGEAGPSGAGGFKAEPGRYHLIISLACPWAHRTLIFRRLKGLESMISLSVVHWLLGERGWTFDPGPGVIPDPIFGASELERILCQGAARLQRPRHRAGALGQEDEHDRQQRIVRNHPHVQQRLRWRSARPRATIIRATCSRDRRAQRAHLSTVNNGVYRAGFATTQEAYEEAFRALFETLDWLEARLAGQRFLIGERLTEADWRLFTTLIRFDPVYFGHFKCNLREIRDYPALSRYLSELYHWPGVAETVDFFHIKHHYYASHLRINPTGIVPLGPEMSSCDPCASAHRIRGKSKFAADARRAGRQAYPQRSA